jgi:hypothetical protein
VFESLRCPGLIAGVLGMLCGARWWVEDGVRITEKRVRAHTLQYAKAKR